MEYLRRLSGSGRHSDQGGEEKPQLQKRTSNKRDNWPAFDTADIHRVNVHNTKKEANQLYDVVRPQGQGKPPSVMEYIVQSENFKRTGSLDKNVTRVDVLNVQPFASPLVNSLEPIPPRPATKKAAATAADIRRTRSDAERTTSQEIDPVTLFCP